jgi:hypothetical protein
MAAWSENYRWYISLPLGAVVSLVSFAAITLCVASQRVFIVVVVSFVIDSVRKLLDIPTCAPYWRPLTADEFGNTSVVVENKHEMRVLKIQVEVFWLVTPCSVAIEYRRFGRPCCLHFQGEDFTTRRHNLNTST